MKAALKGSRSGSVQITFKYYGLWKKIWCRVVAKSLLLWIDSIHVNGSEKNVAALEKSSGTSRRSLQEDVIPEVDDDIDSGINSIN